MGRVARLVLRQEPRFLLLSATGREPDVAIRRDARGNEARTIGQHHLHVDLLDVAETEMGDCFDAGRVSARHCDVRAADES